MKTLDEMFKAAEGIAHFLGDGWYASKKELEDHPGCGDVHLRKGMYSISINQSDKSQHRGKYLFRGRWPETSPDSVLGSRVAYAPENRDDFAVNISYAKTEQSIALELERRLLGQVDNLYFNEYHRQVARMQQEETNRKCCLSLSSGLAAILGTTNLSHNQPSERVHAYKHGVNEFQVNWDGTRLERVEITSIPADVATKIFELLARRVPR